MSLTTPSVNSVTPPTNGTNYTSANITNAPKEFVDIPKNTNIKAEVVSVNPSDNTAVLSIKTSEGKPLELSLKMPVLPKQGSEITFKIIGTASGARAEVSSSVGNIGTGAGPPATGGEGTANSTLGNANGLGTNAGLSTLTDMPVKIVSFTKADSILQNPISQNPQSESISQNTAAPKGIAASERIDSPLLTDKSNNITAVVVYNAKSSATKGGGSAELGNGTNVSSSSSLKGATEQTANQITSKINTGTTDTNSLNPNLKGETSPSLLKTASPSLSQNNSLPLELAPKGSEIVVRFVKTETMVNEGTSSPSNTLPNKLDGQNPLGNVDNFNNLTNKADISLKTGEVSLKGDMNQVNQKIEGAGNNSSFSSVNSQNNTSNTGSTTVNIGANSLASSLKGENATLQNTALSPQGATTTFKNNVSETGMNRNALLSTSSNTQGTAHIGQETKLGNNILGNTKILSSSPNAGNSTPYTITGTILSKPMAQQTIVANPDLTLSLNAKNDLLAGTMIRLEVVSFKAQEPIPMPLNPINTANVLPSFKELGNILAELKLSNPNLATEITSHIPQANAKLAQNLFSFVQAGISAEPTKWLGAGTLKALDEVGEKGRKIISKLKDSFSLNSLKIATDNLGDWKAMNIPFLNGQNIEPLTLYLKRFEDENAEERENKQKTPDVRFMFEIDFSMLGRTQIDGIAYSKNKKLDMVLRTTKKIPPMGKEAILAIYDDTLKLTNYKGTLSFMLNEFIEIVPSKSQSQTSNAELWA